MAVEKCSSNSVKTTTCGFSIRKQLLLNRVNNLCTVVVFCVIFVSLLTPTSASPTECSAVRMGFQARGINVSDLLAYPTNGQNLQVCPVLKDTCCSEATEIRLQAHSKQQFEKTVKDSLVKLSSVLNTRSQRFDDFFREMLANSKREFHEMFKKTYGVIYVQNSYVFTDLFEELENYYNKGQVDLADAMDNFFSVLYQRMFTVINSQYHFDEKYLSCVADHMKDLKPFGDVPQKLSIQIKRSFVATRTFAKALSVGVDVSRNMLSIKPSQECSKSLLRMHHCAGCSGYPQVRACSNYCINVMKGCLAYHSNLENEWNNYVDAMDKISDRLLGSFNIEMVVEPIDIKISEAIMNFQETGQDVSQTVFTGCGKPVLGRRKRSATTDIFHSDSHENLLRIRDYQSDDLDIQFEGSEVLERNSHTRKRRASNKELSFETLKFNDKNMAEESNNKKGNKIAHMKPEGPSLEKLIKDIRHIIKESKRFWSHLPYQICNNEDLAERPSKEEDCWNGTAVSKYLSPVVGDGLSNQKQNPAVFVDVNKQNSLLNEQTYALKAITNKLLNAYQGMDVEWIDDEESMSTYSSGSGSGDLPDDTESDLPDEEGSGIHVGNTYNFNTDSGHVPDVYSPLDVEMPNVPRGGYPTNVTGDTSTGTSGTRTKSHMSLTRALIAYVFPLIVIWFGGMFAELL